MNVKVYKLPEQALNMPLEEISPSTAFSDPREVPVFYTFGEGEEKRLLSRKFITGLVEDLPRDGLIKIRFHGLDYVFKDVGGADELTFAITYIIYKDRKSKGTYTRAARSGKFVYTHSSLDHVRRWFYKVMTADDNFRAFFVKVNK